jgi:hypothetical protein
MYYGTQKFATNCKIKTKIGKQNHWLIKVVLRYTKICNNKQNQNQKLEKKMTYIISTQEKGIQTQGTGLSQTKPVLPLSQQWSTNHQTTNQSNSAINTTSAFDALSPGNFLIGKPFGSPPEKEAKKSECRILREVTNTIAGAKPFTFHNWKEICFNQNVTDT